MLDTSTSTSGWETPRGRLTVTCQIEGLPQADLGDLWRPKYSDGGIAMHGSGSIPAYPASLGCARLSNAAIDLLWDAGLVPIGTPVVVH